MSNRIVGRIRAEIDELAAQSDGTITPEALVEYARNNPLSALHRCFEWDDAAAGERWRLEQASGLIRRYKVKVEGASGDEVKVRAFVSLPSDRGSDHLYRSVVRVLSDEDQIAEMVSAAKMELQAFCTKYAALQKVAGMRPVFDAIAEALDN